MPRRTTRAALIATPLAVFALLSPDSPTPAEPAIAAPASYAPSLARLPDGGREDTPVAAPAPERPAPEQPDAPVGYAPVESAEDRVLRNAMNPAPRPEPTVSIAPGIQDEIDRLNNQPPIELGTITPPPPEPFDPNHP